MLPPLRTNVARGFHGGAKTTRLTVTVTVRYRPAIPADGVGRKATLCRKTKQTDCGWSTCRRYSLTATRRANFLASAVGTTGRNAKHTALRAAKTNSYTTRVDSNMTSTRLTAKRMTHGTTRRYRQKASQRSAAWFMARRAPGSSCCRPPGAAHRWPPRCGQMLLRSARPWLSNMCLDPFRYDVVHMPPARAGRARINRGHERPGQAVDDLGRQRCQGGGVHGHGGRRYRRPSVRSCPLE